MPVSEVLARYGTSALLRLIGALSLFLLLHLARLPLLLAVRVLEVAMRRVDAYATSRVTRPTPPGWTAGAA